MARALHATPHEWSLGKRALPLYYFDTTKLCSMRAVRRRGQRDRERGEQAVGSGVNANSH